MIAGLLYSIPYLKCPVHCLAGTPMATIMKSGEQVN